MIYALTTNHNYKSQIISLSLLSSIQQRCVPECYNLSHSFFLFFIQWIELREMMNGIIREPEATESVSIGIQNHLIFTLRHKETVIGKRFCRIEIEYEHQVFSHISQNLIPIVIPDFCIGIDWKFFTLRINSNISRSKSPKK